MLIQKPRIPIRDVLTVGLLPNFLKVLFYRIKGYKIGKNVSIGFGSVICGNRVVIGDNTTIGFLTIIRGDEIAIGRHVSIGTTVFLDTPHIMIGDDTKINEQVYVGGLQQPDSQFVVGRNCQIMQMTFINPAVSITIGDDTGIGGHCLIFGHTSWLSCFEGYPVDFQPITIGNSVSIAWGAFILPGTVIGDGAVVGARAVASRTIPPRCLAIGYPARVVSKYPEFPVEMPEDEKVRWLNKILDEMIRVFHSSGLDCKKNGDHYSVSYIQKRWWRKSRKSWVFSAWFDIPTDEKTFQHNQKIDVLLSLKSISRNLRDTLNIQRTLWIDIEKKERADFGNDIGEEIVLFLRRYGVRFFRV
jgi:acetyltransferase-like isoleucine patch superfamily enzyme